MQKSCQVQTFDISWRDSWLSSCRPHERVFQPAGSVHQHSLRRKQQRSASTLRCSAQPAASLPASQASNELLFRAVEALFKFQPFFNFAVSQAREKIAERGRQIGLDFEGEVAALEREADWLAELRAVQDPHLVFPDYYTQPFHAYRDGNLCWEAALQVNAAAKSVHAPVMDPEGKVLDPEGDAQLRGSYTANMLRLMERAGCSRPVQHAIDLGCATGLSTLELRSAFPNARITALDLSPHFLAVARHLQRRREAELGTSDHIRFVHAAAEETGLPSETMDLVSCCLVMHELPGAASRAIIAEAHRVLRPGGTLAIMEMNPASPGFQRVFRNPFAYAAFKSTEPWLMEYISLNLPAELRAAGFDTVLQAESTPRHFTMVAVKRAD
ncbi:g3251 [Coccomyxa elongata]